VHDSFIKSKLLLMMSLNSFFFTKHFSLVQKLGSSADSLGHIPSHGSQKARIALCSLSCSRSQSW
jgi:hypothetical protein